MTVQAEPYSAREVALASLQGAVNRDPEQIVAPGHPEQYVDDIVAIGEFRGKDAVRDFFRELYAAASAPFQGIQPTGRAVQLRGVDFFEIATPSSTTAPRSPARSACCRPRDRSPTERCSRSST